MKPYGTSVKYLRCYNLGKHQSKLQKVCKKEKVVLEYNMLHTSQLNGAIERIFSAIKVGALEMLLNAKLNDTAHRILWVEAFYV